VPPYGLVVWARNGETGRPFKAVRLLHKQWRCPVWAKQRPSGEPQIMRGAPEWWSGIGGPVVPDKPVPEPPAFARFAEAPKASPSRPIQRDWWRESANLTYSPAGSVSAREAEGRLLRALLTISATTRRDGPVHPGSNAAWIALQIELVERKSTTPARWRFQPTPRDISDAGLVLGWAAGLWRKDDAVYGILLMRAVDPPFSWRAIAEIERCTAGKLRRVYNQAIDYVVRRANGGAEPAVKDGGLYEPPPPSWAR
jgi:hypothetical protein